MSPDVFYVDGDQIRCGPTVRLPPICVKTGETEDLVEVRKTLAHAPGWIYLLLLLNLCVLLVVYLIVKKSCNVTYYMKREVRNKYRLYNVSAVLCLIAAVGLFIGLVDSVDNGGAHPALMLVPLVLLLTGLVLLVLGSQLLTIARHVDGQQFWLKGFGQGFFDELERRFSEPSSF